MPNRFQKRRLQLASWGNFIAAAISAVLAFVGVVLLLAMFQGQMFDSLKPPASYLPAVGTIVVAIGFAIGAWLGVRRGPK